MAPPAALSHETLDAALALFSGPDAREVPAGGREELRRVAEAHKAAAARAALLITGGATRPPEDQLQGVASALEQSGLALCTCMHGFTAGAGPSLKEELRELCRGVLAPTSELLGKLEGGSDKELRQAVGKVWEALAQVTRGALDNKTSLFRKLSTCMQEVKGAAAELTELVEASRSELDGKGTTNGGGGGKHSAGGANGKDEEGASDEDEEGEEDDEDDDEDDFCDMGHLSAVELPTAEAALQLLGVAQGVLRAVSKPLIEGPAVTADHFLDDMESLAWHAGKLGSSCTALMAALYPPHEEEDELEEAAESVATTLELMLSEFPEDYLGEGARGALAAALSTEQGRLDNWRDAALARLQARRR